MSVAGDSRLERRLSLFDAVVVGLGAMVGAGVFSVLAPAARAAGSGLLIGLGIAAVVAYCNAMSSAWLAARYPESGGTYVYGRERLSPFWGYLAGWAFVVGKTASCAAMALTFGAYALPEWRRAVAAAVVLTLTGVNYFGVKKTIGVAKALLVLVLAALACVVFAALTGDGGPAGGVVAPSGGPAGVLQSAGLIFFAFAGYARIATLGEEVVDPRRTIPRAIPAALAITLVVYAAVFASSLAVVDAGELARSSAPLVNVVRASGFDSLAPFVRAGGAVAAVGVLLSLIVGISRTTFAMAANGDLPRWLDAVHPTHRVPHRAELAVGLAVTAVALLVDLRGAIGFSSLAVLTYYAIANASALSLRSEAGRARVVPVAGLVGCVVLALTLPPVSVLTGTAILVTGAVVWFLRRSTRGRRARTLDRGRAG